MNLNRIADKELGKLEQLAQALTTALVKAKLGNEALCKDLEQFIKDTATLRRMRYDDQNGQYKGY